MFYKIMLVKTHFLANLNLKENTEYRKDLDYKMLVIYFHLTSEVYCS